MWCYGGSKFLLLGSGQKSISDLVPIAKTFVFTSKYIYFCRLICFSTNFALHFFITNLFQPRQKDSRGVFFKYLFYSIFIWLRRWWFSSIGAWKCELFAPSSKQAQIYTLPLKRQLCQFSLLLLFEKNLEIFFELFSVSRKSLDFCEKGVITKRLSSLIF